METLLLSSAKANVADPAPADGDVIPLSLTSTGRLRVDTKGPRASAVTADLAAIGSVLTVDVSDAGSLLLTAKNTGTAAMTGGTFAFEASLNSTTGLDGDWISVQVVRTNAATVETITTALGLAIGAINPFGYKVSVAAFKWFRVRCSVAMNAGAILTWTAVKDIHGTEPAPAVQTHPVTISGTPAVTVTGTATTTPTAVVSTYGLTSAATTNANVVKAAPGSLMELSVFNPTAAIIYVKLFNKTTAPVPGTDVPYAVFPVPVNGSVNVEFGAVGKRFGVGIGIAITAGPLSTDAVAVAAGALVSATYL